jgi:hypothetical protein
MSLRELNARTRRRLRFHAAGWLLVQVEPGAASIGDLFRHGGSRP